MDHNFEFLDHSALRSGDAAHRRRARTYRVRVIG